MATVTNAGQDFEIRTITLNSSNDTIVDFLQRVNSIIIRCRTAVDIYIRHDNNSADYFTIPAGSSLTLDVGMGTKTPCYLRASSGNPIAEIIGTF